MNRQGLHTLLIGAFFLLANGVLAQKNNNSPLSSLGIGNIEDENTNFIRGMGSSGTAFYHSNFLNLSNIASLGRLKTTTLEVGASVERLQYDGTNGSTSSWNGNLDYLVLGFPIFNPINDLLDREKRDYGWGMLLGLKPFSYVGYDIFSSNVVGTSTVEKNFTGSGGLYEMMYGTGFRYKQSGIGLKLTYVIGKNRYTESANFPLVIPRYYTYERKEAFYNSLQLAISAQHTFILERNTPLIEGTVGGAKKSLTIGMSYSPSTSTNLSVDNLVYRRYIDAQGVITPSKTDTITNLIGNSVKGSTAGVLSVGVYYSHNDKLDVTLDMRTTNWTQYDNSLSKHLLSKSYRIAGGVKFLPSDDVYTSYLSRIRYTLGFYYGTDPRNIAGVQMTDYGMSTGFTLPFVGRGRLTFGNVLLNIGRRGTPSGIQERYFTIGIGFTATDSNWFVKPKYE